ncbi:hypothetical protein V8E54_014589 [Elaphomyces granulatus]
MIEYQLFAYPTKKTRSEQPEGVAFTIRQPEIDPSKKKRHEFDYIRGLSNRERVDLVPSRLDGEHRWTIKDLMHYAVTEESTKKRARDIPTAIFDDKEVIDALSRAPNNMYSGSSNIEYDQGVSNRI